MAQFPKPQPFRDLLLLCGIFSIWLPIIFCNLHHFTMAVSTLFLRLSESISAWSKSWHSSFDFICLLSLGVNLTLWLFNKQSSGSSKSKASWSHLRPTSFQSICLLFMVTEQAVRIRRDVLLWLIGDVNHGNPVLSISKQLILDVLEDTFWLVRIISEFFTFASILYLALWLYWMRNLGLSSLQTPHSLLPLPASAMSLAFSFKQLPYITSSIVSVLGVLVPDRGTRSKLLPILWRGEELIEKFVLVVMFVSRAGWMGQWFDLDTIYTNISGRSTNSHQMSDSGADDFLQPRMPGAFPTSAATRHVEMEATSDSPSVDGALPRTRDEDKDELASATIAELDSDSQSSSETEQDAPEMTEVDEQTDAPEAIDDQDKPLGGSKPLGDALIPAGIAFDNDDHVDHYSSSVASDPKPSRTTRKAREIRTRTATANAPEDRYQSQRTEPYQIPEAQVDASQDGATNELEKPEGHLNRSSLDSIRFGAGQGLNNGDRLVYSSSSSPRSVIPQGIVKERSRALHARSHQPDQKQNDWAQGQEQAQWESIQEQARQRDEARRVRTRNIETWWKTFDVPLPNHEIPTTPSPLTQINLVYSAGNGENHPDHDENDETSSFEWRPNNQNGRRNPGDWTNMFVPPHTYIPSPSQSPSSTNSFSPSSPENFYLSPQLPFRAELEDIWQPSPLITVIGTRPTSISNSSNSPLFTCRSRESSPPCSPRTRWSDDDSDSNGGIAFPSTSSSLSSSSSDDQYTSYSLYTHAPSSRYHFPRLLRIPRAFDSGPGSPVHHGIQRPLSRTELPYSLTDSSGSSSYYDTLSNSPALSSPPLPTLPDSDTSSTSSQYSQTSTGTYYRRSIDSPSSPPSPTPSPSNEVTRIRRVRRISDLRTEDRTFLQREEECPRRLESGVSLDSSW